MRRAPRSLRFVRARVPRIGWPSAAGLALLTVLLGGCELANKDADTGSSPATETPDTAEGAETPDGSEAETTEEVAAPEPVVGCAWVQGTWTMVDCQADTIALAITLVAGCQFQVTSQSPVLAGGYGQVKDAGMTMVLPGIGSTCNATYDGTTLTGACSLPTGPCAFAAQRIP